MFDNLIDEIKKKKEFQGLSSEFVMKVLNDFLGKNNISKAKSKKEGKLIVKSVRSELRRYTGQYQTQTSISKREELLTTGEIEKLLLSHISTKERMSFYPELISEISLLKPKSILDLGCGLNPLALARPSIKYYACDIKEDELNLISKFFRKKKISGKAFFCDLREETKFPKADLCLIFKVFDLLDKKGHSISRRIMENLECKKIIVSFSTKKLSGKRMNNPRRYWFENTLESLGYVYETKSSDNEIFYFILKRL